MRYDFQLLFLLLGIAIVSRKFNWKGWFAVALIIMTWLTFNVLKS